MDLLLTLSALVFVLSVITIVGFFITWIVGIIIKKMDQKQLEKLGC